MGEYHAGPVWLGAGLGFSTKDQDVRKSGLDIVGDAGVDIFNKRSGRGSVFFEFRSPVGSDRSFDDHHKFLLGFRMLFRSFRLEDEGQRDISLALFFFGGPLMAIALIGADGQLGTELLRVLPPEGLSPLY